MLNIHQVSRFNKAGQGQFYSASFYNVQENKEIRYIIDCGTSAGAPGLKNEINNYIQTFKAKEKLDFLILSHLHADHVSGLKQLLTRFKEKDIEVTNVFLPYFDKATRIYLYLRWKFEGRIEGEDKFDEEILDFILEPVEFFEKYKVKNIYFIHESDEPDVTFSNNDPSGNRESDINIGNVNVKKPDDNELKGSTLKNVLHVKNCKISLYTIIEFDFWFKSCDDQKLKNFKDEVKKIKIKEELKKIKRSSALYKAYDKLHKNFNDTSLCVSITYNPDPTDIKSFLMGENVLSNAMAVKSPDFRNFRLDNDWDKSNFTASQGGISLPVKSGRYMAHDVQMFEKFGYLFTGDLDLGPNKDGSESDTLLSFLQHYNLKRGRIGVFIVPHHGSQLNWDKRLLEYFCNPFCVISSGKESKYRHPDFTVVKDISLGGWSWVNNEYSFDHGYILSFRYK
ncbi:MBL fold metallo-hydrolase [Priestia aryabhattai]|uniref:MBL fold metallo-hydrolase n=1 Tax=Priestia megaterium TaxID=1404 RepID=UPI003F96AFA9